MQAQSMARRNLLLVTLLSLCCSSTPVMPADYASLMKEGTAAFEAKDFKKAVELYTAAEVLLSKIAPNTFFRGRLLSNIATAKVHLGERVSALPLFEKSLAVYGNAVIKEENLTTEDTAEVLICAERVASMAESLGDAAKANAVRRRFAGVNQWLAERTRPAHKETAKAKAEMKPTDKQHPPTKSLIGGLFPETRVGALTKGRDVSDEKLQNESFVQLDRIAVLRSTNKAIKVLLNENCQ